MAIKKRVRGKEGGSENFHAAVVVAADVAGGLEDGGVVDGFVAPHPEAEGVADAPVKRLSAEAVPSLTYDRGLEWMRHGRIARALGAESYFCLPDHPWKQGRWSR